MGYEISEFFKNHENSDFSCIQEKGNSYAKLFMKSLKLEN